MESLFPIFFLLFFLFGIAALVVWIIAIIDVVRNPRLDKDMRLVWVLVVTLGSWIGAIIYLAIGRNPTPHAPPPSP